MRWLVAAMAGGLVGWVAASRRGAKALSVARGGWASERDELAALLASATRSERLRQHLGDFVEDLICESERAPDAATYRQAWERVCRDRASGAWRSEALRAGMDKDSPEVDLAVREKGRAITAFRTLLMERLRAAHGDAAAAELEATMVATEAQLASAFE